jgi:hypothetical protein
MTKKAASQQQYSQIRRPANRITKKQGALSTVHSPTGSEVLGSSNGRNLWAQSTSTSHGHEQERGSLKYSGEGEKTRHVDISWKTKRRSPTTKDGVHVGV